MVFNDKNDTNIDQISANLDAADLIEQIFYQMLYQKFTPVTGSDLTAEFTGILNCLIQLFACRRPD